MILLVSLTISLASRSLRKPCPIVGSRSREQNKRYVLFPSVAVEFLFAVDELDAAEEPHVVDDVRQHALDERAVGAHGGHADLRRLPHVLLVRLGHRDVELVGERVLQALEDAALVLQGVRLAEDQPDLQGADDHFAFFSSFRATFWIVKPSITSLGRTSSWPAILMPHS